MRHHLFVHNSCVLVILFSHGNEGFFLHFNKHGSKPYSIGNVLHHTHYRGIQQEYICVWQFLLYFCLTNVSMKLGLFGKVTYVTALIWTYIQTWYTKVVTTPLGLTYIATKCSNRTTMITSYVINMSNTFACN